MNTLDSINEIVEEVIKRIQLQNHHLKVEASGRHVHLSRREIDHLFGSGIS